MTNKNKLNLIKKYIDVFKKTGSLKDITGPLITDRSSESNRYFSLHNFYQLSIKTKYTNHDIYISKENDDPYILIDFTIPPSDESYSSIIKKDLDETINFIDKLTKENKISMFQIYFRIYPSNNIVINPDNIKNVFKILKKNNVNNFLIGIFYNADFLNGIGNFKTFDTYFIFTNKNQKYIKSYDNFILNMKKEIANYFYELFSKYKDDENFEYYYYRISDKAIDLDILDGTGNKYKVLSYGGNKIFANPEYLIDEKYIKINNEIKNEIIKYLSNDLQEEIDYLLNDNKFIKERFVKVEYNESKFNFNVYIDDVKTNNKFLSIRDKEYTIDYNMICATVNVDNNNKDFLKYFENNDKFINIFNKNINVINLENENVIAFEHVDFNKIFNNFEYIELKSKYMDIYKSRNNFGLYLKGYENYSNNFDIINLKTIRKLLKNIINSDNYVEIKIKDFANITKPKHSKLIINIYQKTDNIKFLMKQIFDLNKKIGLEKFIKNKDFLNFLVKLLCRNK